MDRPDLGAVERALPESMRRRRAVPAASLTTWRVGGPISLVVHCASAADVEAVAGAIDPSVPVLTVGRGSNLLLADEGFPGVAIVLEGELETVELPSASGPAEVRAGAAVALPVLARQVSAAGWSGLEFYVGIPGSVGGAVRMNAGGHGRDTAAVLRRAHVVGLDDRSSGWRDIAVLEPGYRHTVLGDREVVVAAVFAVTPAAAAACLARVDEIVRWRREHQPGGANAGSVFRNPPGDSAGRLIDAARLKGLRVGGATVSEKHANFIQTEPGATARDVARAHRPRAAPGCRGHRRAPRARGAHRGLRPSPGRAGGHATMNVMSDLQTLGSRSEDGAHCELLAGTPYADVLDAPAPEVDPRFVARLDDVVRAQRRRNGRRTALGLAGTALAVLIGLVAASGLFAARRIEVRGTVHLTADEVRRAAAVHGAPSMLRLDTAAVARRVERLPWVAGVQVSISWPNSLVIRVTEWEPVAYTADHGRWALLASTGRVLEEVLARPTAYVKVVGVRSLPRPGGTIAGGAAVDVVDRVPDALRRQMIGLDLAGGGVTLRLAGNLAVRLGDMSALPAKTGAALAVLGAPHDGCRYIDVSVPAAPVCG